MPPRITSDELFRRLLDAAPDAILIIDSHGRIAHANEQSTRLFHYSPSELLALYVEDLVPDRVRHRHAAHRQAYSRDPSVRPMGRPGLQLVGRRKGGEEFAVAISLSPIAIEGEQFTIAVCRDITEQRRTDEALRRALAHLEVVNRELESFSYSVAHDLRAPLRSIDGFSQALLEDYGDRLDQDGRGYLQRVRSAAQRMAELIDDLLALARVSRAELAPVRVDLTTAALDVGRRLMHDATPRHIDLIVAPNLVATADPRLVSILLENLIGNAVKFTSKRPQAQIHVGRRSDGAFFVKDNGAGFDMANASKLFGVFQRLHHPSEFEGTGIGLATVERIVKRHGGRVWAEARPDEGATFLFALPEAPESNGNEPEGTSQ